MGNLKRQKVKAHILLEGLVALSLFAVIVTLVIGQINQARKEQVVMMQKAEAIQVAQMALQTGKSQLSMNTVDIHVEKSKEKLIIYENGKELLHVQK